MARYMIRFKGPTDGVLYDFALKLRTPIHAEAGEEVSGVHVGDEVDPESGEKVSRINFGPTFTLRVPAGSFEYASGRFLLTNAPSYKRRGARPRKGKGSR